MASSVVSSPTPPFARIYDLTQLSVDQASAFCAYVRANAQVGTYVMDPSTVWIFPTATAASLAGMDADFLACRASVVS